MNIIKILGLVNLLLIILQLLSGFRIIKVSFKVHRITGILLLATALLHGIFAWAAGY